MNEKIQIMDEFISLNLSISELIYCSEEIRLNKLPKQFSSNISEYFSNMKVGEFRLGFLILDSIKPTRNLQDKYLILSCYKDTIRVYYPKN